MKHVLKVGSYLFLTGEIELGHGVAYQGASESSGSSCRPVHVPCPTGEFASNARRGAERTMWFRGLSSLDALEVYVLSRLTHTFCHWDNSYTNYYN